MNICMHEIDRELDLSAKSDKGEESTYGKRTRSPATKKRLAEADTQHNHLQKQCGKELKEMIPETFLEEAKNLKGSNRDLTHTLIAAKLFISSVLEHKKEQEEEADQHGDDLLQSIDLNRSRHNDEEITSTKGQSAGDMNTRGDPIMSGFGAIESSISDTKHKRIGLQWPVVRNEDGSLPVTPIPDISPHDSLLRQALEKLIALTKESVKVSQGALGKKQLDRLDTVHDCIVDMVEDMRKA